MPHPTDVHVGKKVREARAAKGLSQGQLGEVLGVSFQQVQKYEKGTNRIGSSRLWAMSQALDVPIAYFFEGLNGPVEKDGQRVLSRRTIGLAKQIDAIADENIRSQILNLIKACTVRAH